MPTERNISSVRMWKNAARRERRAFFQPLDGDRGDALLGEEGGGGESHHAAADYQDGGFFGARIGVRHDLSLAGCRNDSDLWKRLDIAPEAGLRPRSPQSPGD